MCLYGPLLYSLHEALIWLHTHAYSVYTPAPSKTSKVSQATPNTGLPSIHTSHSSPRPDRPKARHARIRARGSPCIKNQAITISEQIQKYVHAAPGLMYALLFFSRLSVFARLSVLPIWIQLQANRA